MSKTVYDLPDKFGIEPYTSIKSRFHNISTKEVLSGVDLSERVAVVTGASSGLGEYCYLYLALN